MERHHRRWDRGRGDGDSWHPRKYGRGLSSESGNGWRKLDGAAKDVSNFGESIENGRTEG